MFCCCLALLLLSETTLALRMPRATTRRAAVAAAVSAALPRLAPCSAKSAAEAEDEAKLVLEFDAIKEIEIKIADLRARAKSDEVKRARDEEASRQYLVEGDRKAAKRLADEAMVLEADALASDKAVLALREQATK